MEYSDTDLQLQLSVQIILIPVTDARNVGAEVDLAALVEPQDLGAHLPHLVKRMGDEDRGRAAGDDLAHFRLALFAEGPVAD